MMREEDWQGAADKIEELMSSSADYGLVEEYESLFNGTERKQRGPQATDALKGKAEPEEYQVLKLVDCAFNAVVRNNRENDYLSLLTRRAVRRGSWDVVINA